MPTRPARPMCAPGLTGPIPSLLNSRPVPRSMSRGVSAIGAGATWDSTTRMAGCTRPHSPMSTKARACRFIRTRRASAFPSSRFRSARTGTGTTGADPSSRSATSGSTGTLHTCVHTGLPRMRAPRRTGVQESVRNRVERGPNLVGAAEPRPPSVRRPSVRRPSEQPLAERRPVAKSPRVVRRPNAVRHQAAASSAASKTAVVNTRRAAAATTAAMRVEASRRAEGWVVPTTPQAALVHGDARASDDARR